MMGCLLVLLCIAYPPAIPFVIIWLLFAIATKK